MSLLPAQLAFVPRLRGVSKWEGFATYSLISGIVSLALAGIFNFSIDLELGGWIGALQRALVGWGMIWMVVMGVRLLRTVLPAPSGHYTWR